MFVCTEKWARVARAGVRARMGLGEGKGEGWEYRNGEGSERKGAIARG